MPNSFLAPYSIKGKTSDDDLLEVEHSLLACHRPADSVKRDHLSRIGDSYPSSEKDYLMSMGVALMLVGVALMFGGRDIGAS